MSKDKKKDFLKGVGLKEPKDAPTEDANRTMPAEHIVFDKSLLAGFDNLEDKDVRKRAVDHVFDIYKSPHRDKPRNSLLWRRISKFVNDERLSRKTGGVVKEKVKVSREQGDLAQVIASLGITAEDLIELAKSKQES